MLKVIFNNISKDERNIIKVKNNQPYYFKDANNYFRQLQEASIDLKDKKDKYIKIDITLVNADNVPVYKLADYELRGDYEAIDKLIIYYLNTQYVDPEEYDQGMSNYEDDKNELIKQIKDSLDVKSKTSESNVTTTNHKPNLFKRIFKSKSNKTDIDQEVEQPFEETSTIDDEADTYENEEHQDINQEINQTDTEDTVEKTDDIILKSDDDVEKDTKQTDETYNNDTERSNEIDENELANKSVGEPVEEETLVEVDNAPEVEETGRDTHDNHETKSLETHNTHFKLPTFDYVVPQFKKSDLDDYVSKDVQEYLNIKEYERVNISNESIRDLNTSMKKSYLEFVKKNDEAIKQFDDTYAPNEHSLDQFKENIAIAQQNELEEYDANLKQINDQRYENKEISIKQDIDNYKKQKENELNQYKLELESSKNNDLEQKHVELREKMTTALKNKREEIDKLHNQNRVKYKNDLNVALLNNINTMYDEYKNKEYIDIKSFNEEVSNSLDKIREQAKLHQIEVEKERTEQNRLHLEKLKEQNENQLLKNKEHEQQAIEKQNENLLLEKEKEERAERQRRIELEEQTQKDKHEATMKELELKYQQNRNLYMTDPVDKSSTESDTKPLIWSIGTLIFILIALLIYNYLSDNTSYEALLEEESYATIASEYEAELPNLSEDMYKNNDDTGLSELTNHTNHPLVHFRNALANSDQETIIQIYESLNNTNELTDEELKEIAQIYISNRDYESATNINKQLNSSDINKQIAEMTYYEQYKTELEDTIENSDNDKEVERAKKELEQVNIVLGE